MKTKFCAVKFAASVFALMLSYEANAWMDQWAPEFKADAANVNALSKTTVSNYVCTAIEDGEFKCVYSEEEPKFNPDVPVYVDGKKQPGTTVPATSAKQADVLLRI